MPGAGSRIKPAASAGESSASDEVSQLELHLQRQLEEDVARIFDESIYSDIEVVCGKLKILTHSCILRARTHKFYPKLEAILHVNIGRNTFDEIYSFISDAYTECNIKQQEKEIIRYLNENIHELNPVKSNSWNKHKEAEDPEVFLTPKCISPFIEKSFRKTISASPSTELTKEYYALVPIDGNLLEKELIEQEVLSNAFKTIIKSQIEDIDQPQLSQRNIPTSLTLNSSHTPKKVKHSNSCDVLIKFQLKDNDTYIIEKKSKINTVASQDFKTNQKFLSCNATDIKNKKNCEFNNDTVLDPTYSPDSLITDDPSSSSDYLSAAYTCSTGIGSYSVPQSNGGDNVTKMENVFTLSDSGLDNAGMLESLNSHKDVTLTDVSLTDSTLHDLVTDEPSNSYDSTLSPLAEKNKVQRSKHVHSQQSFPLSGTSSERECNGQNTNTTIASKDMMSGKSSKEEKQRQNEEIVILESSSLSSETGSWESVFPPKFPEKEICEKFINNERQCSIEDIKSKKTEFQKSRFKSASCFIDAASLVDEENDALKLQTCVDVSVTSENVKLDMLPVPSRPLPCSTVKLDISPNDWSESNDNEDSLEQAENKDSDSIQKDLSPTIFDMTPITEDSLCTNPFDNVTQADQDNTKTTPGHGASDYTIDNKESSFISSSTVVMTGTPYNSIMSLKTSVVKHESEDVESGNTVFGRESNSNVTKLKKYNENSPILSGGVSIEDYKPQFSNSSVGSPLFKRKIDNIPIVSGAFIAQQENQDKYQERANKVSSAASAWTVDMSNSSRSDISTSNKGFKTIADNTSDCSKIVQKSGTSTLENRNKSRSSVDSDSSEKSSHKFYIDLASLPDAQPFENKIEPEDANEKKNIFSMFIDLGEKSSVKEMPARLSSSLNTKKTTSIECKSVPKISKAIKIPLSDCVVPKSEQSNNSITTFEKLESLCNDPNISISEIIGDREKHAKRIIDLKDNTSTEINRKDKPSRSLGSGEKGFSRNLTTVIHEEPAIDQSVDLFVKLSDLDKPVQKTDLALTIIDEKVLDVRMTRSIPDNTWGQGTITGTSRSIDVISSFHSENALSLNRLFPHLKNEFSRSMPGSLSSRSRSPLRLGVSFSPCDGEEQASDMSEMSSVQSSMCRSVIENSTTEDTSQTSSLIGNCQSRLGQDLLRMFLEEIAPDVIVEVSGRRIKAHKCILSSRCQYFAGILSGGWVESAGNVIALPPFSFSVVHFALCHIYSGVSMIPDSISIVELATIADMLGLEGLKEAIMFTLKAKYCHHFHKPCTVCTAGVLECFPLSSVYGLDDLYRKCLKWITKYFSKVWPTKAFATLPSELLDKCYQQHIVNLTTENFVETVYGCGITVASLQSSRWAETVARLCRRLVNAAAHFAAFKLVSVLRAILQMPPDAPLPSKQALDDCLVAAIEWAPPDEACRAYAFLSALVKEMRNHHYPKPDLIANGNQSKASGHNNLLFTHAGSWRLQCEGALVRAAPRVVGTQAFKELPSDLRKRLRELGCIMYGAQAVPLTSSPLQDRKSRSTYQHKKSSDTINPSTSRSLDIDHVRVAFVPYSSKPAAQVAGSMDTLKGSNDFHLGKSSRIHPPKVRTTKAQEERAKFNMLKTNQSQDRINTKSSTGRGGIFENAKPRYLEPRVSKENEKKPSVSKKLAPRMVSSSESSRNSSPIQIKNLRTSRMKTRQANEIEVQAMSQDSLVTSSRPRTADPSTDSLSESQNSNKYATYTKVKHTVNTSVELIKPSKCHATTLTSVFNRKVKTKIPVLLNQTTRYNNIDIKNSKESHKRSPQSDKTTSSTNSPAMAQARNKVNERKTRGSLMNATKSSSAKMVPKSVKEPHNNKNNSKHNKGSTKHTSRLEEHDPSVGIPAMERSGTFLKDEPTFGDKTTNIDIYQ